jgi:hypothetical protein
LKRAGFCPWAFFARALWKKSALAREKPDPEGRAGFGVFRKQVIADRNIVRIAGSPNAKISLRSMLPSEIHSS